MNNNTVILENWPNSNIKLEKVITGKNTFFLRGYYENGQLEFSERYVNNKREGRVRGYYKSGKLRYTGTCKDGKRTGMWYGYHGNEELRYKGRFENDLNEGDWVRGTEDGKQLQVTYKKGKIAKQRKKRETIKDLRMMKQLAEIQISRQPEKGL